MSAAAVPPALPGLMRRSGQQSSSTGTRSRRCCCCTSRESPRGRARCAPRRALSALPPAAAQHDRRACPVAAPACAPRLLPGCLALTDARLPLMPPQKDTCSATALSLNLSQRRHPRIWAVQGLPWDAYRLVAAPGGGALVLCPDCVLHVAQVSRARSSGGRVSRAWPPRRACATSDSLPPWPAMCHRASSRAWSSIGRRCRRQCRRLRCAFQPARTRLRWWLSMRAPMAPSCTR
jgi:hypothetical protein